MKPQCQLRYPKILREHKRHQAKAPIVKKADAIKAKPVSKGPREPVKPRKAPIIGETAKAEDKDAFLAPAIDPRMMVLFADSSYAKKPEMAELLEGVSGLSSARLGDLVPKIVDWLTAERFIPSNTRTINLFNRYIFDALTNPDTPYVNTCDLIGLYFEHQKQTAPVRDLPAARKPDFVSLKC